MKKFFYLILSIGYFYLLYILISSTPTIIPDLFNPFSFEKIIYLFIYFICIFLITLAGVNCILKVFNIELSSNYLTYRKEKKYPENKYAAFTNTGYKTNDESKISGDDIAIKDMLMKEKTTLDVTGLNQNDLSELQKQIEYMKNNKKS